MSEVPSIPSVSSTRACKAGSKAAHTPEVQLVCWLLVGKTSSPQKKVWLRVCDFPSPVLPRMLTTLVTADESQPSLEQSSEGEVMESCSVWSIRRKDWLSSIPPCKARDCRSVDKTSGKLVLLHWPPTIPVAGWKCSSSLTFTPMCSKLSIMLGPPPSIILAPPQHLSETGMDIMCISSFLSFSGRSLPDIISLPDRGVSKRQVSAFILGEDKTLIFSKEVAVYLAFTPPKNKTICSYPGNATHWWL